MELVEKENVNLVLILLSPMLFDNTRIYCWFHIIKRMNLHLMIVFMEKYVHIQLIPHMAKLADNRYLQFI